MVAYHGRYIGINYAGSRNELQGCINDALDWRAAHQSFLTTGEVLTEQAATKRGIYNFVKAALVLLKPHDWLILQISGHGSTQPDPTHVEPSGSNQLFCPYDLDKAWILDNEWYSWLHDRPPLTNVLFITDCCFSGTMARSPHLRTRPRFIPFQQLAQSLQPHHRERLYYHANQFQSRSEADGIAEGVVHLSGCADDQVSYDAVFAGRANGAMSYYAIKAWHELRQGATFTDWYRRIRAYLPSPKGSKQKFDQRPQINAEHDWLTQTVPSFELDGDEPPPAPAPPAIADAPPQAQFIVNGWETVDIKWRKRAA